MDIDFAEAQEKARHKERDELFKLSEEELSEKLASVQYQRMRHEREIEAYFYVKALNNLKMNRTNAAIWARKSADEIVRNWKNIYKNFTKEEVT